MMRYGGTHYVKWDDTDIIVGLKSQKILNRNLH